MERSLRRGAPRYVRRRRGLSAFLLLAAVPWAAAGALLREPAFHAVAGLFLLAALWAFVPALTLDVDRAAGTLSLAARALSGRVERRRVPLAGLRGVRAGAEGRAALVWIDLPEGPPVLAARLWDPEEARRFAGRLAEDLGCPLRT